MAIRMDDLMDMVVKNVVCNLCLAISCSNPAHFQSSVLLPSDEQAADSTSNYRPTATHTHTLTRLFTNSLLFQYVHSFHRSCCP